MYDLTEINNLFEKVKELREDIKSNLSEIENKINSLNNIYNEVSEAHKNTECTLGIDLLFFQNELIKREHKCLLEIDAFINNRIYCEYYKLYKLIQHYIVNDIKSEEIINQVNTSISFPPYKTLDPLKIYDFELVTQLYSLIVSILNKLHTHTTLQTDNLVIDNNRKEMGLNIDNVIHTQEFLNVVIKEKIKMFSLYLKTFQIHHTKYLTRLSNKVSLVLNIIHSDICLKKNKTVDNDNISMTIKECMDKIVDNVIQKNEDIKKT